MDDLVKLENKMARRRSSRIEWNHERYKNRFILNPTITQESDKEENGDLF